MCNNCQSRELELIPELEAVLQEYSYEQEMYSEVASPVTCKGLSATKVSAAVTANRQAVKDIGWGCIISGKANPIKELKDILHPSPTATEEQLVCAVSDWQAKNKLPATGVLDKRTWEAMNVIPKLKYPLSVPVYFGGKKLGIMEKTAPYVTCYLEGDTCKPNLTATATHGAMEIELGFRITDMDAVKKAGFVDDSGAPHFRWIQTIESNHTLNQVTGMVIKKYSKYVDPIASPGKFDANPYYWNEPGLKSSDPFDVNNYINRPSFGNHLCYDLIFYDRPSRSLASATSGKRVFWNGEVALIGVRKGNKNVILNSFSWGFDIVIDASHNPIVKPNAMIAGPVGGSPMFVQTLNNAIKGGQFTGHCFVNGKFSGKALCV